jgi:hypothetical protein
MGCRSARRSTSLETEVYLSPLNKEKNTTNNEPAEKEGTHLLDHPTRFLLCHLTDTYLYSLSLALMSHLSALV